jgi:diguanylate cyclase (GGDEF)-like protein
VSEVDAVDAVTGLPGRRAFTNALREVSPPARFVLAIDLDRFGLVNAVRGREEGDRLLRDIGTALVDAVGDVGVVARIGGDQFGVLVHGTGAAAEPAAMADLVGETVGRAASELDPAGRTCCIGTAIGPPGPPPRGSARRGDDRPASGEVAGTGLRGRV